MQELNLTPLAADALRAANLNAELLQAMARNIAAIFGEATADEYAAGSAWYAAARLEAAAMAAEFDVTVDAAAGVVAALSPQCSWPENLQRARRFFATGRAGSLGDAQRKAEAIRDGADPLDVLGGRKVRAFYLNILDGSDRFTCTVDRHAIDVAAGHVTGDAGAAALTRAGVYAFVADAYRLVAAECGLTPAQVQAIVWVTWRRLKGLGA
jgi:hypothetical protein